MYTILLLTETTLREHDVQRIAQLHGTEEISVINFYAEEPRAFLEEVRRHIG